MERHGFVRGLGLFVAAVAVCLAVAAGVVAIAGAGGCAAKGEVRAPALTADVRAATFDRYWSELARHYPFFDIADVDWRGDRERWREAAVAAENEAEFYGVLASMLSGLNDPHVALRPPSERGGGAERTGADQRVSRPAVGLVWVERRLFVRRWPEGARVVSGSAALSDPEREGEELRVYPEVVSVAGTRPQRNMLPLLLNGPEGTAVEMEVVWEDGRRAVVELPRPPAMGKGHKEGTASALLEVHPPLMAGTVLEHGATSEKEVQIRWDDGTESWLTASGVFAAVLSAAEVSIEPVVDGAREGAGRQSVAGGQGSLARTVKRNWGDWLTAADLGEVGYLRLATLDYGEAGASDGRSLDEMVAAFDEALDLLIERPALVLDLRYNGGGRPKGLAAVAGRFVQRRTELASPMRRFMGVVPYRYSTGIEPRRPVYSGRIAVLINHETGSAAEHLAVILRREAGAKVVGERSSGAEALVEVVRGPDGSELRYGWLPFPHGRGGGIQQVGVAPDVEVKPTIARVREVGYAEAVREVELAQFLAACRVLGVNGERALRLREARTD